MDRNVPHWFFQQAGLVPCRPAAGAGVRVALVTSASGRRWVIPKGVVDPGETPADAAAREAREEAGLLGTLDRAPIGRYTYAKWGGTCEVEVFLLVVEHELAEWAESDRRERRWMSVDEAAGLVRPAGLATIIRSIPVRLDGEGRHRSARSR